MIAPIPVALNSREFPTAAPSLAGGECRRREQSALSGTEQIAKSREDRDEALEASRRSEILHRSFAFSRRQMRILGSIVEPLVRSVLDVAAP
jgi:hypothetical protein